MTLFAPHTQPGTARLKLAGWFWIAVVEFFIIQAIAQSVAVNYSMVTQDISTLGITECGPYLNEASGVSRQVCSPLHRVMNWGMLLLGALQLTGLVLGWRFWPERGWIRAGLVLLGVSCVGTFAIGVWPANVNPPLHRAAAVLHFGTFIPALAIIGLSLRSVASAFGWSTFLTSLVVLIGFVMFGSGVDFGLGRGITERIAGYPGAVWYMITGGVMVATARRAGAGAA